MRAHVMSGALSGASAGRMHSTGLVSGALPGAETGCVRSTCLVPNALSGAEAGHDHQMRHLSASDNSLLCFDASRMLPKPLRERG